MATRIKKGMLIRRKTTSAVIPIGPWLIVRSARGGKVIAERVDSEYFLRSTGDMVELDKNQVYLPIYIPLGVSSSVIKEIVKGNQWIVMHPQTNAWLKALHPAPEVIMFYSTDGNRAYVTVDEVSRVFVGRIPHARIYIKSVISSVIWN